LIFKRGSAEREKLGGPPRIGRGGQRGKNGSLTRNVEKRVRQVADEAIEWHQSGRKTRSRGKKRKFKYLKKFPPAKPRRTQKPLGLEIEEKPGTQIS